MHTISRVFASKSLGTKNFQYSVIFCIHFLEFCIKILVKYTFLEQRHVLLTISGAFASKSLGSKKSQYCVIQRQGIELVVLDLACHVIGLNAGCLWVTSSAIPGLHFAYNFWSFASKSLGSKHSQYSVIFCIQFLEFLHQNCWELRILSIVSYVFLNFWNCFEISLKEIHSSAPSFNPRRAMR